jgi:CDP-diacylglycerol---serine O-phosphatidyltransferase
MNDEIQDHEPESNPTLEDHDDFHEPRWFAGLEARLAAKVPVPPNLLAVVKLAIVTPLLFAVLNNPEARLSGWSRLSFLLFSIFVLLDYLGGLFARRQGQDLAFGRVLDRITDYPLLFILAYFCLGILPAPLLGLKLLIDLLILALYFLGRGSAQNRLRNGVNYATLLAMLFICQGQGARVLTPEAVNFLLIANIVFNSTVALYNLNVLQKRFIGDSLSASNLLCGVFSMVFAARGKLEFSLLFLMLGAAFDGFDGAASRKFGGTRWGVYSDDVADAVNYGIAPGVALFLVLPGLQGWVLGPFYTVFTLSRLVFFTLNKSASDPNFFCGVPSTLGAIITLCSLILFPDYPALIGMMVGVACVLMVSFDTQYRHLGRALAAHRRAFFGMPFLLIILIGGIKLFGTHPPVLLILLAALAYGFKPNAARLFHLIRKPGESSTET